MDEAFMLFLNDIPVDMQGFVVELDKELTDKGCKRTIKPAKSGYVTSYSSPISGKALLNYVFRKTGVKMRIYAERIAEHTDVLDRLPAGMKNDIKKAGDCKKLLGQNCSPTCKAGYTFTMDGVEYKKCRNMAFFHSLNEENCKYLEELIELEISR